MPASGWEICPIDAGGRMHAWRAKHVCYPGRTCCGDDRMRLVLQLIARLVLIALLCLAAATAWATFDAYRSVDRATATSAERVAQALEGLYWHQLLLRSSRTREQLLPVPEWRTIETMKLISPGICVQVRPQAAFETPLCGQSKGLGQPPPDWFTRTVGMLLGDHAAVAHPISARTTVAGTVSAVADSDAAIQLPRQRMQGKFCVAPALGPPLGPLGAPAVAPAPPPGPTVVSPP